MPEVSVDLKAKDQMSSVLEHVTQRLGIFNKQGLAMGIAFAGVNIAVQGLQQAIQGMIDYIQRGVEANREFQLSMARLSVAVNDFGNITLGDLQSSLKNFSVMFATDLNTLTDGLRNFIREGYSAAESTRLLFEAERLATVTGDDLATVQHGLITAMEVFNLSTSDASDIIKKFNDITSTTGLSISDIDNVLSRSAGTIRTANISFSDIVNILYTLENQGYSSRAMLVKLKEVLDTFPTGFKLDILPEDTVTSIDTKFKKISGAVQFTTAMMRQLGQISQMDLTSGLDISAYFSEEKIKWAKGYFDTLNKQGITTLEQFNSAMGQTAAKALNADFQFIGIDRDLWQLLRAYYQYNDMVAANSTMIDDNASKVSTWAKQLKQINSTLQTLRATLATNQAALAQIGQELSDLGTDRSFTIQMHDATAAVTEQEDAIRSLQRISDQYALSQKKNSLEIMKIQYSAMGERHGLTREQKEAIAALEKTNAGLQIQEQEQQIAMMTIQQNGLQTAQDNLDAIKRQHDEAMYNREIRDLDANIAAKNALYASTLQVITDTNDKITAQQDLWRSNELIKMISWAKNMHTWYSHAYGSSTTGTTGTTTTTPKAPKATLKMPWERRGYQTGGLVQETAPALVHKGEFIIPKELINILLRPPKETPHLNLPDLQTSETPIIASQPLAKTVNQIIIPKELINMWMQKPKETTPLRLPDLRRSISPIMGSQPIVKEPMMPIAISQPVERNADRHIEIHIGTINADLSKGEDVEAWGRKLGAGLSSGFLENTSSGTTTVTSRKTGVSIIVPGTTITTRTGRTPTATIPVPQPIRNKGRFRIG